MSAPKMELRRVKQDAPTSHGWYYGTPKKEFIPVGMPELPIVPFKVVQDSKGKIAVDMNGHGPVPYWPVTMYDWFGPVPTCVESGS